MRDTEMQRIIFETIDGLKHETRLYPELYAERVAFAVRSRSRVFRMRQRLRNEYLRWWTFYGKLTV